MKRIFLYLIMSLLTFTTYAQYVDLGLPSGTKWKSQNEPGFYKYEEAVEKFRNRLPTKAQIEELKNECTWSWIDSGYKVVGPNGKSMYLPAVGYCNCEEVVEDVASFGGYWSSTPIRSLFAFSLDFYSDRVSIYSGYRCSGRSVRLVQD